MRSSAPLASVVEQRRRALGDARIPQGASQVWGLALSGGGIRSATFCLGLLRALARRGMLLRFDMFSTVSGGGYTGATLGRLLSRARTSDDVVAVERGFADADARWFTWWLRANGRYLIPRGAKDTTFAIATYLRNLSAVHVELGLMALLLGVLLACLDIVGWGGVSFLGYAFGESFFRLARYLPVWLPVIVLLLPLPLFAGAVVASAYWCVPWLTSSQTERKRPLMYWAGAIGFVAALLLVRVPLMSIPAEAGASLRAALWWSSMLIVLAWLVSLPVATYVLREAAAGGAAHLEADRARNRLTRWLANIMRAGVLIVLVGVLDRFAWYLAFEVSGTAQASAGLALAVAAAVGRAVLPMVASVGGAGRLKGLLLLAGRVVGYALTFLLVAWWVSLVHRAALAAAFQRLVPRFPDSLTVLLVIGLPTLAYLVLTGRSLSFLNLSSLHAFYRARLVRSYLGAANGARFHASPLDLLPQPMPADPALVPVNELADDDDIAFGAYSPQRHGGPIHIVNMCVNQTRDPRGGLYNQDRRGLLMSIASTGQMRVSQQAWVPIPEGNALTLGTWTAISGAAVAPGLGSLSRGGISALAMFAGLRLGYWWRPFHFSGRLPLLAKSFGLLRETFGIFRGTERPDWFLTDGGHFENTGAYALLAERAQVIVLADCGADPQYAFSDIENLVRKARIDLQAQILFQRPRSANDAAGLAHAPQSADAPPSSPWPPELDAFGSLNDLASPQSSACLALARIDYGGELPGSGLLIVVKPNVSAGLPVDLVNFKVQNPAFPQETTADQFFSEAQWESYFQLGQFLGGKLTRGFVESLAANWESYFEADESSPFDVPVHDAGEVVQAAAEASGRLPSRIRLATVGAGIGLGAAATVAVSAYQAIDNYRAAAAKQVADERAALSELTGLWARVPPSPSAAGAPAAINALAAAIVRTADTLCPTHEAGWFQRSALAGEIHAAALQQCRALKDAARGATPEACATLLEASQPALQSRLPDCLSAAEEASDAFAPPRYWVFDYSADAPFARAHPCDAAAWERRRAAEAYRSTLSLPNGAGVPATAPAEQPPVECSAGASTLDRMDAAFTGATPIVSAAVATARAPADTQPRPAAPSSALSSASPGAPSPNIAVTSAQRERVCTGRTIYIQVYRPAQREEVRRFKEPWRALGASVPPVEDVNATAAAAGRAPPTPVRVTTVRPHDADSRPCADALAEAVHQQGWNVEPLSARLKAIPGVIEVWVPPPGSAE